MIEPNDAIALANAMEQINSVKAAVNAAAKDADQREDDFLGKAFKALDEAYYHIDSALGGDE